MHTVALRAVCSNTISFFNFQTGDGEDPEVSIVITVSATSARPYYAMCDVRHYVITLMKCTAGFLLYPRKIGRNPVPKRSFY